MRAAGLKFHYSYRHRYSRVAVVHLSIGRDSPSEGADLVGESEFGNPVLYGNHARHGLLAGD